MEARQPGTEPARTARTDSARHREGDPRQDRVGAADSLDGLAESCCRLAPSQCDVDRDDWFRRVGIRALSAEVAGQRRAERRAVDFLRGLVVGR
jgi:hypothetical protein